MSPSGPDFAVRRKLPRMGPSKSLQPSGPRTLVQTNPITRWIPCLWIVCLVLAACGSYEDKRLRQLTHEKGFGTRAQGDATRETYVAGGDAVQFLISPATYQQPDAERLFLLTQPQPVGIDGTILVPYIGAVQVLGKTEAELATLVRGLLRPIFSFEIDMQARVINVGKVFFATGEVQARGVIPISKADLTLFEAVMRVGWTQLANLGRVRLVRPDAENPLVMELNVREMATKGWSSRNWYVKEYDILYIPPTFLGTLSRLVERLLAPLSYAVRALFGFAAAQASYEYLTGETDTLPFYYY
ncbi:MAG: hypothetical protein RL148_370 [Planctomycetota bacterium]